jgi:hypothetical protein
MLGALSLPTMIRTSRRQGTNIPVILSQAVLERRHWCGPKLQSALSIRLYTSTITSEPWRETLVFMFETFKCIATADGQNLHELVV